MVRSKVIVDDIEDEEVAELLTESRIIELPEEQERVLDELLDIYESADSEAKKEDVRRAFLQVLKTTDGSLSADRFADFVAEEIGSAELERMKWKQPQQVVDFCELLYRFETRDEELAKRIRSHVRVLLMKALQQFERDEDMEKMFKLLQMAPTTRDVMSDAQLLRLRNRAYLYEMRRVRRNRRRLYAFLALQVVLIMIVFPLLFINAENGAIQETIEETSGVDMPEEAQRTYSYFDGVYWSLITAGSIGYGDITPLTRMGRVIAATLGVMGVLTTGLLAGLILSWVTPRELR